MQENTNRSVEINVLQGEREFASDNKSLGRFILDGIPPAPRGVPQVEVTFDIDANGILNVKAKDKASGKEQHITIQGGTGLSKDEVDRMVKEAASHASEDTKRKEQVEARNQADNLCYVAEKAIKDGGDKVPADVKNEVEQKIKGLREILSTASSEDLKSKTEDLSQSIQKIGQAMYGQGQPGAGPDATGSQGGTGGPNDGKQGNSDTVEGEVVE